MILDSYINSDINLYYQLNSNQKINDNINNNKSNNKNDNKNKSNKINKKKIDIQFDYNDNLSDIDMYDYEKMIEDIYNDNDNEEDLLNDLLPDNVKEYSNNYNIEYNEFIMNNNNNNKIYKHKKKNNNKMILCDECGKDNIIEDTTHGIIVCTNCGQVASSLLDSGAEWSQYNDDNKKCMNRCSHPISQLLPQSSMATTIAGSCSSRIKTLHGWSAMPYKERSLNEVFKIIQAKCAKGKIIKCIEDDAKIMYKNIAECKHVVGKNLGKSVIIRGKNRLSVIAASILFACRKKDKSRSPKEIAEIFGLKHTEITKGCKIFQKLAKITNIELKLNSINPEQFIIRFCEELRVKKNYSEQAIQICNNAQKLHIASVHTPISLATGSIFMMVTLNELNIQKKNIADKFNVSQVTIAKAYKKLEPFTNLLTNNDLCDRLSIEIKNYQDDIQLTDELKIKFIRFNINVEKIFDSNYNLSSLFNILTIDNNNICHINNNLIVEHTIEIDNKLKQVDNEYIKLNLNFIDDSYHLK
jgi:transcription initiation factor TFIIIB Brf1 subunit/transcription initiation factor TFIIB